jgi:hypothetical protein
VGENLPEIKRPGDLAHSHNTLMKMKPHDFFDELFGGDEDAQRAGSCFKKRTVLLQPLRRQQDSDDFKSTSKKSSHHLFPFGDKNSISLMLEWTAKGSVRLEIDLVKREDWHDGHRGMILGECLEING